MRLYSKKLWIIFTALLVIFGVSALATWKFIIPTFLPSALSNYAQEVVGPLEEDLIGAGATKKTAGGNNGHDWGNSTPYYHVSYVLPQVRDSATRQIDQIMRDNGFTLTKATPSNKGQLAYVVGDEHIDSWYFDNTSKQSEFTDLVSGPIEVAVKIGDAEKPDISGETTVRIDLRLPAFKR